MMCICTNVTRFALLLANQDRTIFYVYNNKNNNNDNDN